MITVDGNSLTVEQVLAVAKDYEKITVSDSAMGRIKKSHTSLLKIVSSGKRVYGVTTGFGSLLNVDVDPSDIIRLQSNLIRSHSSGYGPRLDEIHVRAMMLVRLNSLCKGFSGVSPGLIQFLTDMINKQIHPVVPRFGSVGASGDLAPLAHIALAMMGEGTVIDGAGEIPSKEALADAGMRTYSFGEKEGVAFINGTSTISGILAVETALSYNVFRSALNSASVSFEALKGTDKAFTEWAIFGSYERFMAILIENYAGKFPSWMSPMQVYVVPVSEKFIGYATKVHNELLRNGIRSTLDSNQETMNKKIKTIRPMRPSYIVVVGEKEEDDGTVSVRNRSDKQKVLKLEDFVSQLNMEIRGRSLKQTI